jgi:hypothetical protein
MSTTPTTTIRPASASTTASTPRRGRSRIEEILALIDEVLGDAVPAR